MIIYSIFIIIFPLVVILGHVVYLDYMLLSSRMAPEKSQQILCTLHNLVINRSERKDMK